MIVTLRLTQTKIKHALGKKGGYPRRFAQVLEFSGREHACERRSPGRQIAARQIVAPQHLVAHTRTSILYPGQVIHRISTMLHKYNNIYYLYMVIGIQK